MKRRCLFLFLLTVLLFPYEVFAFTIVGDPQYIVMNFASINELNWVAPEAEWKNEIKPQIQKVVNDLRTSLPEGSKNRRLAWSTLQEYMNFPFDEPNENSPYVIKMRRILEIAEEENLPVFLPLNGFQWWDELPELYNWWDIDGTHTPPQFFTRQRTKDFKERFIKGYNPDNKWNVEWQDYLTPMKYNWRDWGGGGFVMAPPPNLLQHKWSPISYRSVMESRFTALLNELMKTLDEWETKGKQDLFAGITIGTEISLNASVKPSNEFMPYGYRGIQDLLCPTSDPTCGTRQAWSLEELHDARQEVVRTYFLDLAPLAVQLGIPKQRIYTHVMETTPGQPRFSKYVDGAFNLYSRPGMSLYGYATNPLSNVPWYEGLKNHGFPSWGATEYSADKYFDIWLQGLTNTLDNPLAPAKVIVIYNWREHKGTPAVDALRVFLKKERQTSLCTLPEILPITSNRSLDPKKLKWKLLSDSSEASNASKKIVFVKATRVQDTPLNILASYDVQDDEFLIPETIHGLLTWFVELTGCNNKKQYSEPRILALQSEPLPDTTPYWVRFLLWYKNTHEFLYRNLFSFL